MMKRHYLFLFLVTAIVLFNCSSSSAKEEEINKEIYLTNFNNLNIARESVNDFKKLKELVKNTRPKAIYIEQWILYETENKKTLKKLYKIAQKYDSKLYLVTGKNTWFGRRGLTNTLEVYNTYGDYVDGVVLRVEPNKSNVWKDDLKIHAEVLNQMLDAYSAIYLEAKKRNKKFVAEFPFWLSDYEGPLKTFSQNVCDYADKIIFLIDDTKKLEDLNIRWNNVPCSYNINLTKRALNQTEEGLAEIYKNLKIKLTLYSNFHGYIIDSNSSIRDSES